MYGCTASLFICDSVGLITNRLRKRARPTTTWLGGIDCKPSALRVSESTMTMRVKLVIIMRSAGATVSSVSATMMVMLWLGLLSVSPRLRLTEAVPAPALVPAVDPAVAPAVPPALVPALAPALGGGAVGAADAGLPPMRTTAATITNAAANSLIFDNETTAPVGTAEPSLLTGRALPQLLDPG